MFRLIYNFLIWLITLTFFPVWLVQQKIKGKPVLPYLFGFSQQDLNSLSGRKVIWIQAASVGETMVADRLIQEIKKIFPEQAIVFTGNTMTGQATAKRVIAKKADLIGYFPFDHPWIVKRFLTRLKPDYLILIETEIWPNVLYYSKKRGVKIAIVNGRLNKSYQRLKKYGFYESALKSIDYIGAQTETDRERFITLGAEPAMVEVTGNIKFDFIDPVIPETKINDLFDSLSVTKSTPILVAASTHHGEEEVLIAAFKAIRREVPESLMVLAPRYPDQAEEVIKLLSGANLKYVRRTEQAKGKKLFEKPDLLLLDTFGELGLAYSIATLAFIGGSLIPIGGHNLLEASIKEKIVLYGPYMHNFQESKELMEEAGTGFVINDAAELAERFIYFHKNPEIRDRLGKKAKEAIIANQGATEKTVDRLKLIFEL